MSTRAHEELALLRTQLHEVVAGQPAGHGQ